MKNLLAVLMIAGLFGFASCGNAEQAATDAANAVDSTAAAATEAVSQAADQATATIDSTAAVATEAIDSASAPK